MSCALFPERIEHGVTGGRGPRACHRSACGCCSVPSVRSCSRRPPRPHARLLEGRAVLNVNSTATGGGVAELLQTLLAYARGAGVNARWLVIEGNPRFFEITKRVHNHLYGTPGDGGPLGADERRDYEETLRHNVADLLELRGRRRHRRVARPADCGLGCRDAACRRARVVWRCHVGIDSPNEHSERGWEFLRPYIDGVDGYVFSREQFAPAWVPRRALLSSLRRSIPSRPRTSRSTATPSRRSCSTSGCSKVDDDEPVGTFTRRDGSRGRVTRRVDLLGTGPPPPVDVPVVLQASRWDALKDMPGVLAGFADYVVGRTDAHLVLAGPQASGVADDPEANQVLESASRCGASSRSRRERRIHLVCVPMDDPDEAAAIVNALQRHATVVVQKSLAEGFGLTVAEAMWKSRPVIGSRGRRHRRPDRPRRDRLPARRPSRPRAIRATRSVRSSTIRAEHERMGTNGRARAAEQFLGDRHLEQWAQLFAQLQPAESSVGSVAAARSRR